MIKQSGNFAHLPEGMQNHQESTKQGNNSMKIISYIIPFFLLLTDSINGFSQTGSLSGKVSDKSNNDELIGANILISEQSKGASTDIDGKFLIKGVPAGTYNVRISYVSYNSLTIENVVVKEGQTTTLNISLEPSVTEMDEVVVTAEAIKTSELSILKIQKNSNNIVDGLSAEMIKKNNSSDGTEILKRMTGVTIADGKYAYIRGVGDRYNNTMLNGANLPSTDPEKKSFSYDLFPANLIESMITSKSFTPDKPADFSGGLVEISTIEFPDVRSMDFGISSSVNSITTFNDFQSYNGGKSDFFGFDDGTRSMPSIIPDERVAKGTQGSAKITEYGKAFENNWLVKNKKALTNSGYKFSIGDKFSFDEDNDIVIGYIGSTTYSSSFENKDVSKRAAYTFEGPRYDYSGKSSSYGVSWGALFNVSLKLFQNHKISFKNIYNVNSDDESTVYDGKYYSYNQFRKTTSFRYVARNLFSTQINGEHSFDNESIPVISDFFHSMILHWNVNYAHSNRDEPDQRRYSYTKDLVDADPDRYKLDMTSSYPTRYYGNLDDYNRGISSSLLIKFFENPAMPNLKFGFNADFKNRDFNSRSFKFQNFSGVDLYQPIDSIFQTQNFSPNANLNNGIVMAEDTHASDKYTSNQTVSAYFFMTEFEPLHDLKVITGIRVENSAQHLKSMDLTGSKDVFVDAFYSDVLPALSLTYSLSEEINLRAAASKTLARPEFRELAPFTYFDFLSYENVEGNPNLKRTLINNYDLRVEYFNGPGQLLALSYFFKYFNSPIEQVYTASSGIEPIRGFANADQAKNYGIEIEVRQNIGLLTGFADLTDFSIAGNYSWIESKIEGVGSGYQVSSRPLQGQAKYVFNAGLYYDNYEDSFSSGLTYNRVGEKISKVGTANLGDVIEMPRNQVDFNISKVFFGSYDIKFAVKDILAEDYEFIQKSPLGDQIAEQYKKGRNFSLGITYKF